MEKEFVSFDQAVVLSELKYDGDYNYTYTIDKHLWYGDVKADGVSTLAAPLKQQVFRWFREKYECYANLSSWIHEEEIGIYHEFEVYIVKKYSHGSISFKTYEEAEDACIEKLLELAKQQDK